MSRTSSSGGTRGDGPRSDPLRALHALGQTLTAQDSSARVVERAVHALKQLLRPDRILVVLSDPVTGESSVAFTDGDPRPEPSNPLIELLMADGPVVIPSEAARILAARGITGDDLPASWVGAPIVAGTTLGAISLGADRNHRFRRADRELVAAVASQTAIALENTRLLALLSSAKREWEQTVDAIGQAFCVVDPTGGIRRANRAFSSLVAVPVTEIPGKPCIGLLPPMWAGAVGRALANPSATAPQELRAGHRIFTLSSLALSEGGAGTCVLVFDDQTEMRHLQDQLVQSEKMSAIGQLIAGVAHDLNNPLASVIGFADYLAESSDGAPPSLREPLRAIRQEAERAAAIVKNLLTFARKQDRQRRRLAVRPLLEATHQLFANQFLASKIHGTLAIDPTLPDVEGDPVQLQQVFVNLVSNAIHAITASQVGSRIVIRATPWLDGVAIAIEDDGPGVAPELRERIFEPFFTTKPEGEGTGLGLSICQGIVKEHGGRMTLAERRGGGSVFRIELPGTGVAAETPVMAPPVTRPLRILVVDDEPHILHYMRATLEAWGHDVALAANGAEGLALATGPQVFDLIITDLRMPEFGGREMFDALRRDHPAIAARVVFSTGDTVRGDTLAFLESIARPYLRKPFTLNELRAVLAAVVA